MKHIGIVGSRTRVSITEFRKVKKAFEKVYAKGDYIVSGGCRRGADEFAERLARQQGLPILIFHADWKGLGKRAGFHRNTDIAVTSDVLIACVAKDRKGGTEDTIRKFEKRMDYKQKNLILV